MSEAEIPILTQKDGSLPRKVMLCIPPDAEHDLKGMVHFGLSNENQIVTAVLSNEQLERSHRALAEERPVLENWKRAVLQDDSARSHAAKSDALEKSRNCDAKLFDLKPPF